MDKKHKLPIVFTISLFIFILRSIFISEKTFQIKYNIHFNLFNALLFIVVSLVITAGVLILNTNITYFIIKKIIIRFSDINIDNYDFKNTLYFIYLLSYSITGAISVITSLFITITNLFITITNLFTLLMSLGNYVLVALLLFIELKKANVSKKVNTLLTLVILIGNSLTVVYMLLQS